MFMIRKLSSSITRHWRLYQVRSLDQASPSCQILLKAPDALVVRTKSGHHDGKAWCLFCHSLYIYILPGKAHSEVKCDVDGKVFGHLTSLLS